jgi:diadenosine tetraphosphate (Ap4A) HIT family hydrolase
MPPFQLDSRLKNDALPVGKLALCQVHLLNDARWPWLLLVPMRDGLSEIHDLDAAERQILADETALASKVLLKLTGAEKINSGALGNIVRQLHIHLIARNEGDDNWPGPVWGYGEKRPYNIGAAETLIQQLQSELNVKIL